MYYTYTVIEAVTDDIQAGRAVCASAVKQTWAQSSSSFIASCGGEKERNTVGRGEEAELLDHKTDGLTVNPTWKFL